MRYITGTHALNIPCSLDTFGDWHQSALRWVDLCVKESDSSLFDNYGIELGKHIPEHDGVYAVANTIRALLDLLEEGNFPAAQGMNENFIGNSSYDKEVFEKVWQMRFLPHWRAIDDFMGKEYTMKWIRFKEGMDGLERESR